MSEQPFEGISPFVQQWLSDAGQDEHIGERDTFSLGYQAACAVLSTMVFDVYGEYNPPCGPSRRNRITGRRWVQPEGDCWVTPEDDEEDPGPEIIVQSAPPVDPRLIERIYYMALAQGAAGEFARGMAWMAVEIARVMDFPLAIRHRAEGRQAPPVAGDDGDVRQLIVVGRVAEAEQMC